MRRRRETLFVRWFTLAYADEDRPWWKEATKWVTSAAAFVVIILLLWFVIWFVVTDQKHTL